MAKHAEYTNCPLESEPEASAGQLTSRPVFDPRTRHVSVWGERGVAVGVCVGEGVVVGLHVCHVGRSVTLLLLRVSEDPVQCSLKVIVLEERHAQVGVTRNKAHLCIDFLPLLHNPSVVILWIQNSHSCPRMLLKKNWSFFHKTRIYNTSVMRIYHITRKTQCRHPILQKGENICLHTFFLYSY